MFLWLATSLDIIRPGVQPTTMATATKTAKLSLDQQNNMFARTTPFCAFLCSHCTTMTWKCLKKSRFIMQDVTTRKKFHFFFRYCPQNSNPQGNWPTFEKFNRWNKRVQANASYLGSCNVAVQEISQVRKENISNEQKKKIIHTRKFSMVSFRFHWQCG